MQRLGHYFGLHKQNAVLAFDELRQQPLASLLTIAVIGIALALPAALSLLVQNGRSVAGSMEEVRDFSVYMQPGQTVEAAEDLAGRLRLKAVVREVRLITAEQALEEFREASGLDNALEALETNPLPHTLVVRPDIEVAPEALESIAEELRSNPAVDQVRIDTDWVRRLNAILELLNRSVWIAAILLITAVIIIVGNTIRLDIQNRRDEIEVYKLLGASNGFVRRPFLYTGICYGLTGGVFGLILLVISALVLAEPIERLTGLYGSQFVLRGLNIATIGAVLGGGLLAGWGGAWSAVSRHISAIQPK